MKIQNEIGIQYKDQLLDLEQKERSSLGYLFDFLICIGPFLAFILAVLEYRLLPDIRDNPFAHRYIVLLTVPIIIYLISFLLALILYKRGDKQLYRKILYKAPLYSAIYIFLTLIDLLTLKSGMLMYPSYHGSTTLLTQPLLIGRLY